MRTAEDGFPLWRKTTPVSVDVTTLRFAEQQIESCESCEPDEAQIPFDYLLDELTGCDPEVTDYVLPEPARCPRCSAEVRAGFWRWYTSADNERMVFVLPGTLINLKKD